MASPSARGHSHWRLYLLLLGPIGGSVVIAATIGEAVLGLLAVAWHLLAGARPEPVEGHARRRYRRIDG